MIKTCAMQIFKIRKGVTKIIIDNPDMQMTPPLWQKAEELKCLLMKLKEESE